MNVTLIRSALAGTVLFIGIVFLFVSLAVWYRFKVQIPFLDTVQLLPLVELGVHEGWRSLTLQEWLEPISGNTHRIVVTRVLMLIDYLYLDGRNYALYLSAWLSIALMVFVYVRAAGLWKAQNMAGYSFVAGLALIYLCSPTQFLNLVNPVNACWYVAFACSAASVFIVVSGGRELGFGWWLLAMCLAASAAFSNFVGVVACVLLPLVAFHQRTPLALLVLAFSVALVFFYFKGIEADRITATDPTASTVVAEAGIQAVERLAGDLNSPERRPALLSRVVRSVRLQLGAPLSREYPISVSLVVLASVVLVGSLWIVLLFRWVTGREPLPRFVEFCLIIATICIGTSIAIPLGRHMYTRPLAPRYQTVAMMYWLNISCLLFVMAQGMVDKPRVKRALVVLALVPTLPLLVAFGYNMAAATAVANDGSSAQILGRMGFNPFKDKKGYWPKIYDPYFEDYRDFLADYGFEPLRLQFAEHGMLEAVPARCSGFWLEWAASDFPGVQKVRLRPLGISSNPFLSRVDLRGANGELGRLYPIVTWRHDVSSLFFDGRVWQGYYRGRIGKSLPITLYVDPAIGSGFQCTLTEVRTW